MRVFGVIAMCLIAAVAQAQHQAVQVAVVEFSEKTIYHSPETPGYTSWVGQAVAQRDRLLRFPPGYRAQGQSRVERAGSWHARRGDTWTVLTASAVPSADKGMLGGYTVSPDGCRGMAVLPDGTLSGRCGLRAI